LWHPRKRGGGREYRVLGGKRMYLRYKKKPGGRLAEAGRVKKNAASKTHRKKKKQKRLPQVYKGQGRNLDENCPASKKSKALCAKNLFKRDQTFSGKKKIPPETTESKENGKKTPCGYRLSQKTRHARTLDSTAKRGVTYICPGKRGFSHRVQRRRSLEKGDRGKLKKGAGNQMEGLGSRRRQNNHWKKEICKTRGENGVRIRKAEKDQCL